MNNINGKIELPLSDIPLMIMMVGLPGSGKSTLTEGLGVSDVVVHSSDKLRKELYGDENSQEHNNDLFKELHKRIKDDLKRGFNVIYDATNINKKRRISFIKELRYINCKKICICAMTPYEVCLKQNSERRRNIPNEVIKKMYMTWSPPSKAEGFNEIYYYYYYGDDEQFFHDKYKLSTLFRGDCGIDNFEQKNSHHALTLGEHCRAANEYVVENYPSNRRLHIAALLHDNGKVFTQTNLNANGIDDGEFHYYQHHCVGAYESLFYTNEIGMDDEDKTYIANLIYFHMHPFMSWRQSKKAEEKDKVNLGDKMYSDILRLHEADRAAH